MKEYHPLRGQNVIIPVQEEAGLNIKQKIQDKSSLTLCRGWYGRMPCLAFLGGVCTVHPLHPHSFYYSPILTQLPLGFHLHLRFRNGCNGVAPAFTLGYVANTHAGTALI